ncbi:unnamed protein product [marine sediment metagenome]|uniref:Uncharacterized protein n=1 Tax=marine sediment metagenome TaxID=412755 RepID=X1SRA9_9ZZZZ
MTPKEQAIWQQLANSKAYLDAAADTLKYLSFERLSVGGVARCKAVATNIGFVTGTIERLADDLEAGRFPFRVAQVGAPDRQGSLT